MDKVMNVIKEWADELYFAVPIVVGLIAVVIFGGRGGGYQDPNRPRPGWFMFSGIGGAVTGGKERKTQDLTLLFVTLRL